MDIFNRAHGITTVPEFGDDGLNGAGLSGFGGTDY
jgi:hypothetical protein